MFSNFQIRNSGAMFLLPRHITMQYCGRIIKALENVKLSTSTKNYPPPDILFAHITYHIGDLYYLRDHIHSYLVTLCILNHVVHKLGS